MSTMVNLWKPWCGMWDCDKIMEPMSKQIMKPSYNEPNIEGWQWEKINLKKGPKKDDSSKPI
jgi:hypothetical protein